MPFDTKIALVVRLDLAGWQKLNMTAFLAGGIAGARPELIGEPYEDGSGNGYLPMFGQPVLVFGTDADGLRGVWERALAREVRLVVFTDELFTTGNDDDNRAAVRAVPAEKLTLAGLAVHGPRNRIDKIIKGLALHP